MTPVERDLVHGRLAILGTAFAVAFVVLAVRVLTLSVGGSGVLLEHTGPAPSELVYGERADIVDRNGVLLATNLNAAAIFADPSEVIDVEATARALAAVLVDIEPKRLRRKLLAERRFVWIKRVATPAEQQAVIDLGLPGVYLREGHHRVYPQGRLAAHVLGFCNVDNVGLSGVERAFDAVLAEGGEPLRLSIDLRVQSVVREELNAAVQRFSAVGGAAVMLDVGTGEVLAMVSLPDFDPNRPVRATEKQRFNRNTLGTYELGSLFKVFTAAMALDSGAVRLDSGFDATEPLRIGRHTIRDYHAKKRWLSVPEIVMHSSNIGAGKMALAVGADGQRAFLDKLGLLERPAIELLEVANPQYPDPWRDINTVTISYGHGIAVTPLQVAEAVATVVNDGMRRPATLLPHMGVALPPQRVIAAATSEQVRWLLWLTVAEGTGSSANVPGYLVGGKTGTAEKAAGRGYDVNALLSSFVAVFPMHAPRYVVFAVVDEPQGTPETYGYATGGWTAAPAVGRIIDRVGPILGVPPVGASAEAPFRERLLVNEILNPRTRRTEPTFAAVSVGR